MSEEPREMRIRRAPRIGVFLFLGALLGVVAALIGTTLGEIDPAIGFAATFGYFAIWGLALGLALGAAVAILFDWISRRRARTVLVQRTKAE